MILKTYSILNSILPNCLVDIIISYNLPTRNYNISHLTRYGLYEMFGKCMYSAESVHDLIYSAYLLNYTDMIKMLTDKYNRINLNIDNTFWQHAIEGAIDGGYYDTAIQLLQDNKCTTSYTDIIHKLYNNNIDQDIICKIMKIIMNVDHITHPRTSARKYACVIACATYNDLETYKYIEHELMDKYNSSQINKKPLDMNLLIHLNNGIYSPLGAYVIKKYKIPFKLHNAARLAIHLVNDDLEKFIEVRKHNNELEFCYRYCEFIKDPINIIRNIPEIRTRKLLSRITSFEAFDIIVGQMAKDTPTKTSEDVDSILHAVQMDNISSRQIIDTLIKYGYDITVDNLNYLNSYVCDNEMYKDFRYLQRKGATRCEHCCLYVSEEESMETHSRRYNEWIKIE